MNAHCPRHSSKYGLWVAYQSTGTSQGLGGHNLRCGIGARPSARLRSFCLSGRSVEHELSDGLSRHFSFPCWHPVAGPAGAFRIERIAIVPAPGLLRRTTVPAGTRHVSMQSISILADNKLAEKAGWVLPFSA